MIPKSVSSFHGRAAAMLLAALLCLLGGCLEVDIRTTVEEDGSSERIISIKRPTRSLPDRAYPLPADSSWTIAWRETGEKEKPFEYVAAKRFPTIEALNEEYAGSADTPAADISVVLEREPGWFFTDFSYREVFSLRNPFRRVPPAGFFTPEEIDRVRRGDGDDSLRARIEEWDSRNVFEEYFGRLTDPAGGGIAPEVRARLQEAKEDLYTITRRDSARNQETPQERGARHLETALGRPVSGSLAEASARALAEVDSMRELRRGSDAWKATLVLPGTVISSNGTVGSEGDIRWEVQSIQLLVTDVPLEAKSRAPNVSSFAITGGAVLLALLALVLRMTRRAAASIGAGGAGGAA